jgi:hypothetical protein
LYSLEKKKKNVNCLETQSEQVDTQFWQLELALANCYSKFQRNFCITDGKIILMSHEKIMEFSRIKQIWRKIVWIQMVGVKRLILTKARVFWLAMWTMVVELSHDLCLAQDRGVKRNIISNLVTPEFSTIKFVFSNS